MNLHYICTHLSLCVCVQTLLHKDTERYANTNEHKMQVQCFINTNISNVLTTVLILVYACIQTQESVCVFCVRVKGKGVV